MLTNTATPTIGKQGGAGHSPVASKPLDVSWENGVVLSSRSLVRLEFQLPEN